MTLIDPNFTPVTAVTIVTEAIEASDVVYSSVVAGVEPVVYSNLLEANTPEYIPLEGT